MRSKPLGVSVICVFNGFKVSRFSCSTHVEQRFQPLSSVSQQFPTGRGGETTVSRVELVCSAGRGRLMPRDLSCDLSFPVAGRVEGRCLKMKHRSCLPSRTSKWPEPLFFLSPQWSASLVARGKSITFFAFLLAEGEARTCADQLFADKQQNLPVGFATASLLPKLLVGLMNDKQTQECRKHSRQFKKKMIHFH